MGGLLSRLGLSSSSSSSSRKYVEVVNNSQLSLHLWVNGGGPVCRCGPHKTTTASLPAHLSHGPYAFAATLDLPEARSAGMQGLQVCSWSQTVSLRLNVDNGCDWPPFEPGIHPHRVMDDRC